MHELTNGGAGSGSDVSSSDNSHHHHQRYTGGTDSMDGGPSSQSRRLSNVDEEGLQSKRKALADIAVWLSGLNATTLALDDWQSLSTGRAFAELLHEIDKSFFTEKWLESMPTFSSSSGVVVKRSNLRKLWRKISDYITTATDRNLPDGTSWMDMADRLDGFEERDLPIVLEFAMLVVVVAHIGPKQQRFVQYSQELSAKRNDVMANIASMIRMLIDELPEVPSYLEVTKLDEDSGKDDTRELCITQESTSNGHSRRRTSSNSSILESQRDALRKEKEQLQQEVERLTKALDAALLNTATSSESNDVSLLERQNEELKLKRREAEERVHELEAQIEQHRGSLQELTIENDTLRSEQKDLIMVRNKLLSAQDEVEEWKVKASQFSHDVEHAKKREKEVKELNSQVKSLTTRLEHHVKQSTIDEDNKETVKKLRQQIGTLKGMVETLEMSLASKERLQNDLENQLIQQKEKVKALEDRKEDLIVERNLLQEKLVMKESITPRSLHESMFEGGNLSFDEKVKLPPEIEVQRLQERISELEALEPLQGEIINLKSRCGVLEEEILVLSKQKEDLLSEVTELREKEEKEQKTHVSGDYLDMKVKLEKTTVELERLQKDEERADQRVGDLEKLLKTRDAEVEKYQDLLNKSKKIIDELELCARPVGEDNGTSVQQFKSLQAENEMLNQKVEKLEIELQTVSTSMEQENRLITSAAHQMVLNRPVDGVMGMRAAAGADSENGPQTLLETQKMSGALPWSLLVFVIVLFIAWILVKMYSAMNAPPIA